MKLRDALFREPYQVFRVIGEYAESFDDFNEWELEPLMGPTLAREYVRGPFEGLFIVAGKLVTQKGSALDCYVDIVLPERICEHHFLLSNGQVERNRGRRVANGNVIPAIAIEKFGGPELFYAKADPAVGIEILQKGLQQAREKRNIAYDLGMLLSKERRYEEAINVFAIVLDEEPESTLASTIYQERYQMHAAIGQNDKAEEDKRLWAIAFAKIYGHPPTEQDLFWK